MKRSDFIKTAGLFTLASSVMGNSSVNKASDFSMKIITTESDEAIKKIDEFLSYSKLNNLRVSFKETQLSGTYTSDLVFLENQKLINPKMPFTPFSGQLNNLYNELELSEQTVNPVLLSFSTKGNNGSDTLELFKHNKCVERVSLKTDQVISFDQSKSEIEIKNGQARFIKSPCKHKTCMKMGKIARGGESIVCIPEQIHATITGKNKFGVDSFVY